MKMPISFVSNSYIYGDSYPTSCIASMNTVIRKIDKKKHLTYLSETTLSIHIMYLDFSPVSACLYHKNVQGEKPYIYVNLSSASQNTLITTVFFPLLEHLDNPWKII